MNKNKLAILLSLLLVSVIMLIACKKESQENSEINRDRGANVSTEIVGKNEDMSEESSETQKDEISEGNSETNVGESKTEDNNTEVSEKDIEIDGGQEEIRDISSAELVKEIQIGWNLGNTLDATGGSGLMSETSWGNPRTSKEIIDTVKIAGFNTLRVPTTWEKHLGPAPEYIINEEWLNRVQEVVEYGISNEMFVILNMHHEEWHFPSYDNADKAKDVLIKVWKQIAERFQNYDEHLIFEGLNEPRLKGTNFEWNGGNEEGWDVVNQLNKAFVDTIRNSGGNNSLRHLMIPPYAATSSTNAWNEFIVPEDDKVIVSIHAYTPYNFALNKTGSNQWGKENSNDTREIDYLMDSIYHKFVSQGIPVIIGEFGAMNKDNLDSRVEWAEYYVYKAAEKGIPCIWWDNGAFNGSGENFGLLNRRLLNWEFPEVVDSLMKGIK